MSRLTLSSMGNELVLFPLIFAWPSNVVLTLRCRIAFGPGAWRRGILIGWSWFRFFWFGEFVHVLVSQWRISCPPTLFLAFPLAAAVFLIVRWYSRELFVHSMWLIFQFPRCCSPYVFSIGLCFPWIFFNIRWTIWNSNYLFLLMNVFSTLSVSSPACSWIPSNILSLSLIDL